MYICSGTPLIGWGDTDTFPTDLVCKLNKSLYGLKQAPLCWNEKIGSVLISLGFSRNESDHGLYSRGSGHDLILLALYVDDLLIAGANPAQVDTVKGKLASVFKMKDLGPASYFLGMRINQTKDFIVEARWLNPT